MTLSEKLLPKEHKKRTWVSVGLTLLITLPLTLWGIYAIGEYGLALFVLTPFLIGLASAVLFGLNRTTTRKEAVRISMLTLGVFTGGLIIFAIEGLICIAMAAPPGILFTWVGGILGFELVNKKPNSAIPSILLLTVFIPLMAFMENDYVPPVEPVVTRIVIDASPDIVWDLVVEFPQLDDPEELVFRAGIAYPINARIEGTGVGAIRYCNFNTGSFVEPITIWDEPRLLAFDVVEQPEPMKEISLWDVHAPHLNRYFVSKRGQFRLTKLPDGRTELEGTTWYYHDIKPDFYWRMWSDWIIHSIHTRVLQHIKKEAEALAVHSDGSKSMNK